MEGRKGKVEEEEEEEEGRATTTTMDGWGFESAPAAEAAAEAVSN